MRILLASAILAVWASQALADDAAARAAVAVEIAKLGSQSSKIAQDQRSTPQTGNRAAPAVAAERFPSGQYQADHRCRWCGAEILAKSGAGPVSGSHLHICPRDGFAFWHYDQTVLTINRAGGRWRR